MFIDSAWLKQYVSLPKDFGLLSKKLTQAGFEITSLSKPELDTTYLRIAKIIASKPHPNADRLTLCQVETQDGKFQIVCGAKNFKVGDHGILATPGAVLPNGMVIQETHIRGEHSQGMLCSEKELGLKEAQGILILSADADVSQNVRTVLGLEEVVFELQVTPNRPDAMSHIGVAREISAIFHKPLKLPRPKFSVSKGKTALSVKVIVQDSKKCPRYMGCLIQNIQIGPSPVWLVKRLKAVGLRSINNVVDVTNYVLMEYGQPIHAFDADRIQNHTILVRSAKEGETLNTLDEQTRKLESSDLVIADIQGPIGLAGMMGGKDSEVSLQTKNIFIESAYFDPVTIRKTSKRLGLHSEASRRFEKGVDIEAISAALERVTELILQVAGGTVQEKALDDYPKKFKRKEVELTQAKLDLYLGNVFTLAQAKKTLETLGFKTLQFSSQKLRVQVPGFRIDVTQEVDLIEEVARLLGYDKIPAQEPTGHLQLSQKIEKDHSLEESLKTFLTGVGFLEVIHPSFCSPEDLIKLKWNTPTIAISNPIGLDTSRLRPTLLIGLLKTLHFNMNRQEKDLMLYEMRPVFFPPQGQRSMLTGVVCGNRMPSHWGEKDQKFDFFDLKAIVEGLFETTKIKTQKLKFHETAPAYYHPGIQGNIILQNKFLGSLGQLHPEVQEAFHLKEDVFIFEIDIDLLRSDLGQGTFFKPLPKYPFVRRDISFLVPKSVTHSDISKVIWSAGDPMITDVELFDLYLGTQVKSGYKSLAYRLTYHLLERTLTDAEVQKIHEQISKALQKECNAEIR